MRNLLTQSALNCALGGENNYLKGDIPPLVTYITHYNNDDKKTVLLSLVMGKDIAVNDIIRKLNFKKWRENIDFDKDFLV